MDMEYTAMSLEELPEAAAWLIRQLGDRRVVAFAAPMGAGKTTLIAEMARQNLTGEELAQKAGVGRSAVQKMRKGQPVWRNTAGHVAAALGVPVDDLKED